MKRIILRVFALMHAWHLQYWTRCYRCGHRFSDWFVWDDGRRFCFLCWSDSDYETVIREGIKP